MTTLLWSSWTRLAFRHVRAAADARAELMKLHSAGDTGAAKMDALSNETSESMLAVCCAVFACEALTMAWGDQVMDQATLATWKQKKTSIGARRGQVFRRALGAKEGTRLDLTWDALFDDRNYAVHYLEEAEAPAQHPSGIGGVSAPHARFTAERAGQAEQLLTETLAEAVAQNQAKLRPWLTAANGPLTALGIK